MKTLRAGVDESSDRRESFMNQRNWFSTLPLLLLFPLISVSTGCASYEYDLIRPERLAGHITSKQWQNVTLDDLEYRLIPSNARLVFEIFNPADEPVKLIGDESAVVD